MKITTTVLISLIVSVSALSAAELKFYLPFDEGSGEKAFDTIGRVEGVIKDALWVDGKVGKALSFDGKVKAAACVVFSDTETNEFLQTFNNGSFSITCWVKFDGTHDYKKTQEIINAGNDNGPGWRIAYTWGRVFMRSGTDKVNQWDLTTLPTKNKIPVDEWVHLAFVRDKAGIGKLYLNGEKVTETTKPIIIHKGGFELTVGAFRSGSVYGFKGIIDEVKIYAGELTSAEIVKDVQ